MTLFMPPIQRKKKVDDRYRPDSFRVISEDAISDHPKYRSTPYAASFEPRTPTPKASPCDETQVYQGPPLKSTRVLPQVLADYRGNKPQPLSCGFLDKNVRFLNEPICNVYTKPVQHEEKKWWPSRANPDELCVPPYSVETNYRTSYSCKYGEKYGDRQTGSGRHSSNLNRDSAKGIIPVSYLRNENDEKRFYKEGVSYEHMYNCRSDPNYPIRGKRHGGFVWNRMDPISQKKFVEYYEKLNEEERKFEEMKVIASAKSKSVGQCNDSSQKKTSPVAFTPAKLVSEGEKETTSCKPNNLTLTAQDKSTAEDNINQGNSTVLNNASIDTTVKTSENVDQ